MIKKLTQKKSSYVRICMILIGCITIMSINENVYAANRFIKPSNLTIFDQVVKGVVKDKDGPLPGVTVSLKGNDKVATATDINGRYSLKVPDNSTLIFKAVGYTAQEIALGGKSEINVTLEGSVSALDEVVVVGYTSKALSQLSSSVSVVSGDKLRDVTSNDVTSMLQGKAPGVIVSSPSGSPSQAPSIVIRGSSSITAGSDPLYVVDGVIGGSANPNDVESVTILKDAAATGLYGSRAANGVIIITTKSGKAGKNQVNFNLTTGVNNATMGNFKVMNAQQLYDYTKTFYDPATFNRDRPASLLNHDTNWLDLAFRTALTQNYTISVSGGSDRTQAYVSANYYNEQGTLRTTGNTAYNLRANVTHKISDKFKLTVRLNNSFRRYTEDASGNYGAIVGATRNLPFDYPYNADGSVREGTEANWLGREHDNFLHGWQYNLNDTKQVAMNGDVKLEYFITPNLTFSTSNRGSYSYQKGEVYYDVRAKAGMGLGQLTNSMSFQSNLISSNQLHYEKNFGKHSLSAIAVAEAEKNYSDANRILGQGFVAGLHVLNAASTILSSGANNGSTNENAFSKGLVQVDYNYDNRYFAVASYINEASSRFGANKRAGNFYTLGGSWILSNEAFMQDHKDIDLLKVRASYGQTGNAQISNYQTLGLYSFSSQYSGLSASVPSQLANPDLTWEKAKTINFGVDISMFKRITLNVDVYDKTTAALLLNVQLPYTSGFSSVIQNIGSVRNRGLEINLNTVNLNKAFRWETNFNIAFNRSKVLKLDKGADIITDNGFSPPTIVSVGHDLNSFYMRKWAGVDPANGDPLWEKVTTDASGNKTITKTNSLSDATPQFVGSFSPKFTGGFTNTFSYKAFTLSAFFNFVSGNMVFNSSRQNFDSDGAYETVNSIQLINGWSRWTKPGDIATHPKAVFGGNKSSNKISSRYLEDGSYLRLRNATFGYNLPKTFLSKLKIASARVFVSGDNIWTLTKYSGMDPEIGLGPGGGNSADRYPISRKFLFGINLGL